MHSAAITLKTNCGPLSNNIVLGIPYRTVQCSKKAVATIGAVPFAQSIARVSLLYQSVITKIKPFPYLVFVNGPSVSMVTNSNCPFGGNNCIHLWFFVNF